jgi:PPE-repeat protein
MGTVVMNFSVLAPEINSARMFSGAGSAPMLSAAGAWDSLASELGSAASSFSSVTSGLTSQAWQGPASAAMVAAAAPYAGWLNAAATRATGAAGQARAVAGAYEAARAATVHPLQVAANRNGLVQLVETNLFGQNAPAIAAVEAEYEQMWAQDVAAMAGYHAGASAAAAQLPAWEQTLHSLATRLASALGLSPVTNPNPADPDLMSQTTKFGPGLTVTSFAEPDDDFVATQITSPGLFSATLASGTVPLPPQPGPSNSGSVTGTFLDFRGPLAQSLPTPSGPPTVDSIAQPGGGGVEIGLPFTDPLAPLFTALLPLGF